MTDQGPTPARFGRRGFITSLALAGATALTDWGAGVTPAVAAPHSGTPKLSVSNNGWSYVGPSQVERFHVEGSPASVSLLPGDTAVLLTHVLRRFHYEVLALGHADVLGHATDPTTRSTRESNYLSGTAVSIRPDRYPLGLAGSFTAAETAIIRDILLDCEGAVRWAGDDLEIPAEGCFHVDVPPGDPVLPRVADAIREWTTRAGSGAGAMPDPFASTRLDRSTALAARQRASR